MRTVAIRNARFTSTPPIPGHPLGGQESARSGQLPQGQIGFDPEASFGGAARPRDIGAKIFCVSSLAKAEVCATFVPSRI
jgi:hypothetical protein